MQSIGVAENSAGPTFQKIPMRAWATPVTVGAFLLMSATGVLMFFGVRGGLISEVHEWFSWLFLAGAVAHLVVNYRPLILHLRSRWGRVSIAAAAALLVVAVLPTGIQIVHRPHQAVEQAVVDAPLSTLASLAHIAPQDLENRLKAHGIAATLQQSARELAQQNRVDEREVIAIAFRNE
jgi:Domain of unknown function (DUF4405)